MDKIKANRWTLVRDVCIFQVKLGLDAFRDLLLSPVSIACALYDLIKGHDQSVSSFYKLMALGHKSDSWLNLFGAGRPISSDCNAVKADETKRQELREKNLEVNANVDQLFTQVESLLREQHAKGGLTASAKSSIDSYLDKIITKKKSPQMPAQQNSDPTNQDLN
jgi:hypothetical protein